MKNLIKILFFCVPTLLLGQYEYLDIPLQINGVNSPVAWAGGLNNPQFSPVDLNNDNIEDLVIYDRSSNIVLTFINNGTVGQVDYRYSPAYQERFPQNSENFVKLRDFDNDGIVDIFFFARPAAYPSGSIGVLKGYYDITNKIAFTPFDSTLTYDFGTQTNQVISFYNPDIPAIDDIDNDGDMDIIAFSTNFIYARNISWYKNMSVENGNGGTTLEFELHHQCWGMVSETNSNNTVYLSPGIDSCADNSFWKSNTATQAPRHAGSTLTAIDYNGDGYKDMLMGDAAINTLNLLTTTTINDTFLVTAQDSLYPSYNSPADILSFPVAAFLDVNNDGKKDMIVSPNERATGDVLTDSVAWYYQNTQTNNNIQLALQQKDFLVGKMIDLGRDATPVFFDYNADGLLDVLIGHYGYCQADQSYKTGLSLLKNIGTASQPDFDWITRDYANLGALNWRGMHPTMGDLDGDNDIDMLLGLEDGTLVYLENTAGTNQTATWATAIQQYKNIDVGTNAAPQLVDLDRDGDLDLAIGAYNGNIAYFENTGTAANPIFSATATTLGLGGIDVRTLTPSSRRPTPCFVEVDGHFELFVGHQSGYPIHYKGIDNNILGNYTLVNPAIQSLWTGFYSALDLADINNDGRLDMVIGNNRGGLSFFAVDTNTVAVSHLATRELDLQVYPNPARHCLTIGTATMIDQALTLRVYNALGQEVLTQKNVWLNRAYSLDIAPLQQGIYILKIENNKKWIASSKFVKI